MKIFFVNYDDERGRPKSLNVYGNTWQEALATFNKSIAAGKQLRVYEVVDGTTGHIVYTAD